MLGTLVAGEGWVYALYDSSRFEPANAESHVHSKFSAL